MQVVDSPGSSVVCGQVTAPTSGSSTTMSVRVTVPELVTTNWKSTVSPSAFPVGVPPCLSNEIAAVPVTGVDSVSVSVTSVPLGSVPVAVAVLSTVPPFTSAWVTV